PTDANVQAAGQPSSSSRSAGPTTAGTTTAQIALAAATGRTGGVGCGPKVGAGGLDVSKLLAEYPAAAEYIPWINKGAQACPDTPAPLIAAQRRNESGFERGLVSPAQAMGPAQFLQGTWDQHAVDGDGDGKRDINNVADAVMSQAAYNCELMGIVKDGLASG